MEPAEYPLEVGENLRATRIALGMSLRDAEVKSRGRHKAPVIGSYERADRSVTIQKLAELAEFYQVPVSSLLPPQDAPEGSEETVRVARAIRSAGISPREAGWTVRVRRQLIGAGTEPADASAA